MIQANGVNDSRKAALLRIDRNERHYKIAFLAAAVLEGIFLAVFLLLMDFSNRLHTLLLLATVATYSIIILGLVALAAHLNRSTLRLLKAIEVLNSREADR